MVENTIDYHQFIAKRALLYQPSSIRGLFTHEKQEGMISMLAGKPNGHTFPFDAIHLDIKPVDKSQPPTPITIDSTDLFEALQYSPTSGLPRLVSWLNELQDRVHLPNQSGRNDWRISMTNGSADGIHKACQVVLDEGDSVLIESPAYPGTIGMLWGLPGVDMVPIDSDDQGLRADLLEEVLQTWPKNKPFPKMVYTCPTGANPTGTSTGEDRKTAVLKLVKKYNLLLFEDDAYYFVYYGDKPQPRSYFALEQQVNQEVGRVVRFDSCSKILSSGIRIGFVTGPKILLDAMDLITSNTNLQPTSLAQAVTQSLLLSWGHDRFIDHCKRVSAFYKQQRDMAHELVQKHLKGMVDYVLPEAGMFLWLQLKLPPGTDTRELLLTKGIEAGILCCPGAGFFPTPNPSAQYARVSFSLCTQQEADEGFRRLAMTLKQAK